eukprot:13142401-Alexandrium_andersonii.AAC.1
MINASREGPVITRKTSQRMLAGLLKYIGQHSLHLTWPNLWVKIKEDFDIAYTSYISSAMASIGIRK